MSVECFCLTKRYGRRVVLDDVSLEINDGGVTGLIGPNGAGKSTLIKLITGLIWPTEGFVLVDGFDAHREHTKAMRRIGAVIEWPAFIPDLSARANLDIFSGGHGRAYREKRAEILRFMELESVLDRKVGSFSTGMRQRLGITLALLPDSEFIILDEPTSQLDPIAAADFLGTLRKMSEDLGLTVILTEHRLEEALPMADMLAVLDEGRLIAFGEPKKTVMQVKNSAVFESMPAAVQIFAAVDGEGDAPLTVSDARAFIASRTHASVKAAQPSAEPNPELAAELKNCWFRYEKNAPDILRGLSLTLNKGEIFALLGGNGSGKSTTAGLLSGRLKPYRGKVKTYGARVAALPQDPRELFVKDTVLDELKELDPEEALLLHITELLELEGVLSRHPFDISGGEQQRLALGKVLLTAPDVLLLDEPTKGMDGEFKRRFGELLSRLKAEGKTIFLVSHDIEFCAQCADRCALLFRGEIVCRSAPRKFFSGNFFYTTAAARLSRGMIENAVLTGEVIECLRQ